MADIISTSNSRTNRRGNRHIPKVDLTAMVDLGFLLITFFMLASSMIKPKSMEIIKPYDSGLTKPIPISKTLTLLLGNENKIYHYVSESDVNDWSKLKIDSTDYSSKGLRSILLGRKKQVGEKFGNDHEDDLFILIKPTSKSTLQNTVDVMDEITITSIKRYAILTPKDIVDSLVIKKLGL